MPSASRHPEPKNFLWRYSVKSTILVVEDDLSMLAGVKEMLQFAGYEVITAEDGLAGLRALQQTRPDLIISDIMMPGMDGYEFLRKVRENPKWLDIPIIFLTAKGEKADIRLGKQLGVDDYLTKPFDTEDLLVAVEAKLKRSRELQAVAEDRLTQLRRGILDTLSHELRTPLTLIHGYAELISEETGLGAEELKSFLRGLRTGSERLNRLVEDLLLLISLETGEMAEDFARRQQRVSTEAIVRQVALIYRSELSRRGSPLRLTVELPESLPEVMGDMEYLVDALSRLVDNAIKFSKPEGGEIRLRASQDGAWVRLEVEDEGIGIPAAELPRLFQPLYQVNRKRMEQQGAGVGLAIAKGLVELHGGRIEVESEEGVGSRFSILLPAC